MASASSSSSSTSTNDDSSSNLSPTSEQTQTSISMTDYVTQLDELESTARDILPYSFERCTAPLGPLRQSVYSCLTCSPVSPETQRGGICYSCSIQCHGSHNLVELFCKRNFTCDCGTLRMGSTPCALRKTSRQQSNPSNTYNHNFDGRFCDCDQIYDPDSEEGTMFQCLVCEDWFHEKCIGEGRVPDQDEFDGFVCRTCVGKNEWLGRYVADKKMSLSTLDTYPEVNIDVETVDEKKEENVESGINPSSSDTHAAEAAETAPTQPTEQNTQPTNGVKRSLSEDPETLNSATKRVKVDSEISSDPCKWATLPSTPSGRFAMFLKQDFRNHLCRCLDCETSRLRTLPMISEEEETYEPDEDNSDTGYFHISPLLISESLVDAGTRALSSLPRTQAIDGIAAYQTMSSKLKNFLQGFVETKRVVSAEDVRGFFADIQGNGTAPVGTEFAPDSRKEESAK